MFHVVLVFTIIINVGVGAGQHSSSRQLSVAVPEVGTGTSSSLLEGTQTSKADTSASLLDGTETTRDEVVSDWQPEPQDPTGKFTTATEVKPILTATKSAWVALREYDGKDLLYFTHLVAWRCGLHEIHFGVNGAAQQVFEVEDCYIDTAQPNAIKMESHLPYIGFDLGTVDTVTVTLIYDDGSKDSGEYGRKEILMP